MTKMTTRLCGQARLLPSAAIVAIAVLASSCASHRCDDCAQDGGIALTAEGPGREAKRVVLLDGWRAGRCEEDLVCVGATSVALGDVRWDLGCRSQVVVFASGFAPTVVSPQEGGREPSVELWPLVTVPIVLRVVSSTSEMQGAVDEAMGDVREANRVFSRFGAGIVLDYGGRDAIQRVDVDTREGQDIQLGCSALEAITGPREGPRIFEPGTLNVYLTPGSTGWGNPGESCWGNRQLIFVRRSQDIYGRLPHEVGHALGLTAPHHGHANEIEGFGPSAGNLMDAGVTEVTGISLGQAYRMNFDPRGPLQRQARVQSLVDQPCGDDAYTRSPCPPMNLNPSRSWQ